MTPNLSSAADESIAPGGCTPRPPEPTGAVRYGTGLLLREFAVYAGPGGILADLLAGRLCSPDIRKTAAVHAATPASVATAIQETAQLAG